MSVREKFLKMEASHRHLKDTRSYEAQLASVRCDVYAECIRERKKAKIHARRMKAVQEVEVEIKLNSDALLEAVADIGQAHRDAELAELKYESTRKHHTLERRHLKGRISSRTQIAADKVKAMNDKKREKRECEQNIIAIRHHERKAEREEARLAAEASRANSASTIQSSVVRHLSPPPIRSPALITLDHMRRTKGVLPVEGDIRVTRHVLPTNMDKYLPMVNVHVDTASVVVSNAAQE